jgi:hypothetical protein
MIGKKQILLNIEYLASYIRRNSDEDVSGHQAALEGYIAQANQAGATAEEIAKAEVAR